MSTFKSFILYAALSILVLTLSFSHEKLYAQTLDHNPMADVYTVAGVTLVGAILGVSTLSFVGNPGDVWKKHLGYGISLGIIAGVVTVISGQAQRSQSLYQKTATLHREFSREERLRWHEERQAYADPASDSLFLLAPTFRF